MDKRDMAGIWRKLRRPQQEGLSETWMYKLP